MILHFHDLQGIKKIGSPNFEEGIGPHIWRYREKTKWYVYQPNEDDYQKPADTVRACAETPQELV